MRIQLGPFGGLRPALEPHLLGENEAQTALDARLETGALDGLPANTVLKPLTTAPVVTLWRYPHTLETNYWLEFIGRADVARSPVIGDVHDRIYWTDSGGAKYGPASVVLSGSSFPGAFYKLGVPLPTNVIVATGTLALTETRAYRETFLTAYDEEGPAGPASNLIDIDPTKSVTLENLTPVPSGQYNIDRRRIYRSIFTGATQGSWQLVDTIPVASDTYVDSKTSTGAELSSDTFLPPPDGAFGLRITEGGVAIVLSGRQVHMSEPDLPHAFNPDYIQSLQYDPVAIACFGQMVVILTKGSPYVGAGIDPAGIQLSRIAESLPCLSYAGVVESKEGVLYPSVDGLVSIGTNGIPVLVTTGLITEAQWQAYNPASFIATLSNGRYVAHFTRTDGSTGVLMFDVSGRSAPMVEGSQLAGHPVTAAYLDQALGYAYVARNGNIERLEKVGAAGSYVWRSRNFRFPQPALMAAMAVFGDPGTVTVRFYADGVLRHSRQVKIDSPGWKTVRLPSNGRFVEWSFQIEGSTKVTELRVAPSVQELFL